LRLENLPDSIKNFELASKIIKEDFSYYEEISSEQLARTEVFILDNLSNLYSMQNQNHQSIKLMNNILDKEIDKKTEILTKYKLAKYKCILKEYDDALIIINELINYQYFEPVALAVANPEFKEISPRILEILQIQLVGLKKSFSSAEQTQHEKINLLDIGSEFKSEILNSIESFNRFSSDNFKQIIEALFSRIMIIHLQSYNSNENIINKNILNAKMCEYAIYYYEIFNNTIFMKSFSDFYKSLTYRAFYMTTTNGCIISWLTFAKLAPDMINDDCYPKINKKALFHERININYLKSLKIFEKELELYNKYL
jgi:hypothetical protein